MSEWHLAPALVALKAQLKATYPTRDTRSDGTIGDVRHQNEAGGSDHNPDATGSVNAFDITHGPFWQVPDLDVTPLVNQLVALRDPRMTYVIFQRRIWTPAKGWHAYSGVSPHLEHCHVSITHVESMEDNGAPWNLPILGGAAVDAAAAPPASVSVADLVAAHQSTTPSEEDDDMFTYARNQDDGTIIRMAGNTYVHLDGPELALDEGLAKLAGTPITIPNINGQDFALLTGSRQQVS